MRAIGKYLVVERIKEEVKSSSGLLVSAEDANNFRYHKGLVLVPGVDVSVIKEGDIIYYDKSRSFTLPIEGVNSTIIDESAVVIALDPSDSPTGE